MIACSPPEAEHYRKEIRKCRKSPAYFLDTYCQIYDATLREWVPFRLWPAQIQTIQTIANHRLTVILKARQLGLSWLVLGYALWLMLFCSAATVLLFSRRDDEAVDLLGTRLRGMYDRLPAWLKVRSFGVDNGHEWELSNGSRVLAFPTTAGDSYTATLVIVDEADLVPDLGRLMASVKPTIDGGGRMVLLSRADKSKPESPFKRIYVTARQKLTDWAAVFLPWNVRPGRDAAWYADKKADVLQRTGALDDLHEQYPATDVEALSPRALDKRIPAVWLHQCFDEKRPCEAADAPAIPGLAVFAAPVPDRQYVIGLDPAEGNPTSNDSALTVLDVETGEEVAALAGRIEPSTFASYAYSVARFFNDAAILCERNNHGHACLLWLKDHGEGVRRLYGHDGREGWLSSTRGKTALYDTCADAFKNKEVVLHSFPAFTQLSSIDGNTLRAPDNMPDDRADAFAIAVCGRLAERANSADRGMAFTFGNGYSRRW